MMAQSTFGWLAKWLMDVRSSEANRLAIDWIRDSNRIRRSIHRDLKKLRSCEQRLRDISETVVEDLEEANHLLKRHEEAVNGMQAELLILKELTVPGLTTSHELVVQRAKADIAAQVRK